MAEECWFRLKVAKEQEGISEGKARVVERQFASEGTWPVSDHSLLNYRTELDVAERAANRRDPSELRCASMILMD